MRKVFRDVPVFEITLRKFEKPSGDKKSVIRKLCISLGLLQPGDSRDIIVDLLCALIDASHKRVLLSSEDLYSIASATGKKGAAKSNVRRNLLKLKELGIVEKFSSGYRLVEYSSLRDLFIRVKSFFIEPMFDRVLEYCNYIDSLRE